MKNKLWVVLLSLLLLPTIAFAQTEPTNAPTLTSADDLTTHPRTIPEGCGAEGFSFQNGQLILGLQQNGLLNHLYLIRNNSDYEQLLLSHPTHTAMSAGWDSRIDEGQWSALAITRPNFVINCFGRRSGAIGYVDCKSVLEVCAYTNADTGGGSYWVAENSSLFDTISL